MPARVFRVLRHAYEYRHEPEEIRRLASWYWRGLLVLSAAASVAAIAYGIVQLVSVMNTSSGAPAGESVPPLKKEELDALLQAIDARRAATESLMASPISGVDPSATK